MKILTFSTLYPNTISHKHGIFVENRLRHLVENGNVTAKVVAPVPWFPLQHPLFGEYANFAKVPSVETRHNIEILHPRYPLIPKIGMTLAPVLMAMSVLPQIKRILKEGYHFQLIDAHYFYPDGIAAYIVAKILKKPVVITSRGTDLSLIPQYYAPRRMIQKVAKGADGLITVCQALKDTLIELGTADKKVTVLRNGVDLDMFQPPKNRDELRKELKITGTTLLSVGHLIARKGHDIAIEALGQLADTQLIIAGDGPEEHNLKALVNNLGLQQRVRFLGSIAHTQLAQYYGAVDILVLASSREGWANVLLESMACGTPVVASNVWGTPEVVAQPAAGLLAPQRTANGFAVAIKKLMTSYPDRVMTRQYAEKFSWQETTYGQESLFTQILQTRK